MNSEKESLRKEFSAIRDAIPEGTQVLKSVAVWKYFFDTEEYKAAKTVMLYSDIKSEVKTTVFAERIISDGKRLVFPVCNKETREITPYAVSGISKLRAQAYGILEPSEELIRLGEILAVSKDEIDIVVVPAIVFDLFGDRIGYGGGFYDRFLKDFKGFKVGVSYSECVCYSVPAEETDVKVDMLITEAGCERFGQEI